MIEYNIEIYHQANMLNRNIDNLIVKFNCIGFVATKLDLRNNQVFILHALNQRVITPLIEGTKGLYKII